MAAARHENCTQKVAGNANWSVLSRGVEGTECCWSKWEEIWENRFSNPTQVWKKTGRLKGDPVRNGNGPGKSTGYSSGKGKGARGRGAVGDQVACSSQSRAPVKPILILEPS